MNTSQESKPVKLNTRSADRQAARDTMLSDSKFITGLSKAAIHVTKKGYHSTVLVKLFQVTGILSNFANAMDPDAHTLLKMQQILTKQKRAANRGTPIERTEDEERIVTEGIEILKDLEKVQRLNDLASKPKYWK